MPEHKAEPDFYVAPSEPPPSRRAPITAVGPLGWLRANLFSSPANSIATLITGALIVWFLWSMLSWSVKTAQWGVVYNNLRLIMNGLYDKREIWRMELTAGILVLLTGLGFGIWGRVARGVFIAVLVILLIMLIIPIVGARIPEPTIYVLVEPRRTPYDLIFIGYKGQELAFELDPLTDLEDADKPLIGFVENRSRTEWSTQTRNAKTGELDLSQYNLAITLQIRDRAGKVLEPKAGAESGVFNAEQPGGRLTFKLPGDGWYILRVQRDDTANGTIDDNRGYAWLKTSGVEIFASQEKAAFQREEDFGPMPASDNPLEAEENAYRFESTRSLGEFISLQILPFIQHIAFPLVVGAALFFNGWVIGVLGKREKMVRRATLGGWILAAPVIVIILYGFSDSRILPQVPPANWGGLLLTMVLTVVGITASFPVGVALALGRRSDLPVVKWISTLFIETVRGVPLITILFMSKQIVPFFSSVLKDLDLTIRMMIGLTLFSAAYLAENVRGGLQVVPPGQIEAARALGLNPVLTTTFIILPQALRAVIPAIVGQFISLFKDTSLVAVVGLFELVGIVDIVVSGQAIYRPFQREAYIFVAIIYFVISYAMSDVSRRLEESGAGSVRRLK
jgi:His/Glu/Gln/Arg/opine family amino acid ABC transporter permease subunit